MTTDDEIRADGWTKISETVPHRDDCPGIGNGCTTDFWAAGLDATPNPV